MDYRIVERQAFKVVGKPLRVSTKGGENFKSVPAFWWRSVEDGTCTKLAEMSARHTFGEALLGIGTDFNHDMTGFTYLIAAEYELDLVPEGFMEIGIPAANWAAFESVGPWPHAIQRTWTHIRSEFFPSSIYDHALGCPDLELYRGGDPADDDYRCEVWVPVVEKS